MGGVTGSKAATPTVFLMGGVTGSKAATPTVFLVGGVAGSKANLSPRLGANTVWLAKEVLSLYFILAGKLSLPHSYKLMVTLELKLIDRDTYQAVAVVPRCTEHTV